MLTTAFGEPRVSQHFRADRAFVLPRVIQELIVNIMVKEMVTSGCCETITYQLAIGNGLAEIDGAPNMVKLRHATRMRITAVKSTVPRARARARRATTCIRHST